MKLMRSYTEAFNFDLFRLREGDVFVVYLDASKKSCK
jgi:hypothetical protein